MIDVRTRLLEMEGVPAPDLWPDIVARRPGQPAPPPHHRGRGAVILLAFGVVVLATAVMVRGFVHFGRERTVERSPSPRSMGSSRCRRRTDRSRSCAVALARPRARLRST